MNAAHIRPIDSTPDIKKFIACQKDFYPGDPNFVPPIMMDRLKLLNVNKNPFSSIPACNCFWPKEMGKWLEE